MRLSCLRVCALALTLPTLANAGITPPVVAVPIDPWSPSVKWDISQWGGTSTPPLVVNTNDDNNDNYIGSGDIPEVFLLSRSGSYVVNGATGVATADRADRRFEGPPRTSGSRSPVRRSAT